MCVCWGRGGGGRGGGGGNEREIVNVNLALDFWLNQWATDLHSINITRVILYFSPPLYTAYILHACAHSHSFVCHLCVVSQETDVGSEINPQQLQMKTAHTSSQLIKPRVFVYSYNNSSVWGMGVGPALCVVLRGLWLRINHVFVLAMCCWDISFD